MDVQYAPELREPADRLALLKDISARLDKAVGPKESAAMKAEWELVRDLRGDEFYRLTLEDPTDRVFTDFTRFELGVPLQRHMLAHGLYGDLLKLRGDRQHQVVLRLLSEMSAEQEALHGHQD